MILIRALHTFAPDVQKLGVANLHGQDNPVRRTAHLVHARPQAILLMPGRGSDSVGGCHFPYWLEGAFFSPLYHPGWVI